MSDSNKLLIIAARRGNYGRAARDRARTRQCVCLCVSVYIYIF